MTNIFTRPFSFSKICRSYIAKIEIETTNVTFQVEQFNNNWTVCFQPTTCNYHVCKICRMKSRIDESHDRFLSTLFTLADKANARDTVIFHSICTTRSKLVSRPCSPRDVSNLPDARTWTHSVVTESANNADGRLRDGKRPGE